jgi:universal stress protein A
MNGMEDINRILVLSQSTKQCKKAVHYGISLAKAYEAKLYVMHIIHNPFGLAGWNLPLISLTELDKDLKKMFQDARADLDRIIRQEETSGLSIEEIVVEADPLKEVFSFVEQEKIDLLVMVSHEEWRLEHFIFGREIHEIVRRMPCSVLLVQKSV